MEEPSEMKNDNAVLHLTVGEPMKAAGQAGGMMVLSLPQAVHYRFEREL